MLALFLHRTSGSIWHVLSAVLGRTEHPRAATHAGADLSQCCCCCWPQHKNSPILP